MREMIIYYAVYRRNGKMVVDAWSDIGGVNLNEFESVGAVKKYMSSNRYYKNYKITYQRTYKSEWNN